MARKLRNLLTVALALLLSTAWARDATSETSEQTSLLWPTSLEQYHKRFAEFDKQDAENMPAPGCTVSAGSFAAWIPQIRKAFAGKVVLKNSAGEFSIAPSGLMRFTTDQHRSCKTFAIANRDRSCDCSLENEPDCISGQSWSAAPAVAMPYAGTWHTAARRYRAWVDT